MVADTTIQQRIRALPQRVMEAPASSWGKWGAYVLLGGFGFGWIAFPYIFEFAVSKLVTLKENSEIRPIWVKLPMKLNFNVYLFNLTNPDEVENGGIPVVQEIGPYVFEEQREKVSLIETPDDDTITYSAMITWYFMKEKTYPLTGAELITLPHLPLMSGLLIAESDFPPAVLSVLNMAIPGVYGKLKSVFMTATAWDYLFDGILINCTSKEMLPRIVCVVIEQNSKALKKVGKNLYKFSIFGPRNNTPSDVRITVKRGSENMYDIGKVVAVNGRSMNTIYRGDSCNRFIGTDGTIFPPFREPNNYSISTYAADICRVLQGIFVEKTEFQGITGYLYTVSLGDMQNNPSDQCYCPSETKCFKKGLHDLKPCLGAPLLASLPHFYDSDDSLVKGVIGLSPNKSLHEIKLLFEPTSGVPLSVRNRLQFNIEMHPIRFINLTKKIKRTTLPIAWVEEGLDLEGELMDILEGMLLRNLRLVDVLKWSLIGTGGLIIIGGVIQYRRQKNRTTVISLTPTLSSTSQVSVISYSPEPLPTRNIGTSAQTSMYDRNVISQLNEKNVRVYHLGEKNYMEN